MIAVLANRFAVLPSADIRPILDGIVDGMGELAPKTRRSAAIDTDQVIPREIP